MADLNSDSLIIKSAHHTIQYMMFLTTCILYFGV